MISLIVVGQDGSPSDDFGLLGRRIEEEEGRTLQ